MMVNIVFDQTTIACAIVLLAIGILSTLFSPFVRFRKRREDDTACPENSTEESQENALLGSNPEDARPDSRPSLSVILTPHDEADKLEKNLPCLLAQDYPAGYQVIVVIEKGDHETENVVKRLQNDNTNLYMTYIPESSRYMSRKKLAMTLGVKAARTEWILLTEAYSRPVSSRWLQTMADNCHPGVGLVIGYGCYDEDVSVARHFHRFYAASYLMREDASATAYRTLSHNIMMRKSDFMEQEGFRGNLELIRGEYDFLVNKYATPDNTVLETHPDAWMIDDAPSDKSWISKHVFYIETRKLLERSARHRAWFNVDQSVLHLSFWTMAAVIACAAVVGNIVVLAAAVVALMVSILMRTIMAHKAFKAFSVSVPTALAYPLEMTAVWHNAMMLLRHRFSDKLDFTTHKQ